MAFLETFHFLLFLPAIVFAHGHVGSIISDGKLYDGFNPYTSSKGQNTTGWITGGYADASVKGDLVNKPDIICHTEATPASHYVSAIPGTKVTFQWATWAVMHVHPGPVIDYIAKCDGDCATQDKTTLKWVKMDAAGQRTKADGTKVFASDDLEGYNVIHPLNNWNITIPNIAPGNYVIRHEIIALHRASRKGGVEFYPQCINFRISGDGKEEVTGGVVGTSLYTDTEPGILWNVSSSEPYPIPGPPLGKFTYL